jgi:ribonuclease P protein component
VLARQNRVTSGADYRTIVRRGRRSTTGTAIVSALAGPSDAPTRFGFIVSKKVGNAVIRVLPGMERTPWATLQEEMASAVTRAVRTI